LDFKHLQSDQVFLVYVTQAHPEMKLYLKGFHLLLEIWRGGRDGEGLKLEPKDTKGREQDEEVEGNDKSPKVMEDVKIDLWIQSMMRDKERRAGPLSGLTKAVFRFKEDMEAILELAAGDQPAMRCVRSNHMLTTC
jgi:hypothetical protein